MCVCVCVCARARALTLSDHGWVACRPVASADTRTLNAQLNSDERAGQVVELSRHCAERTEAELFEGAAHFNLLRRLEGSPPAGECALCREAEEGPSWQKDTHLG
eukprot:COSAG03_NODE_4482_length_1536_cov_6.116214_2_plen_105_part_00